MDNPFVIRTENLTKTFRNEGVETPALKNVNLNISEGEFVSIMGPSGCGKTTLLNILGLLDRPTSGNYYFLGKEVAQYTQKQRTQLRKNHIGFVFQSFNLIEELTVYENIELPLLYQKINWRERRKRINELMDRMHLIHRSKHFPQQLSGGLQQRVAVARAIISRPTLIFADEPTGNLDSVNGSNVMQLLTELNEQGATIVMVTHSADAARLSHRVVNLFDGYLFTTHIGMQ